MKIDILLATYNGAVYLQEQLDSILAQTHQDWRVIARDDGSTDVSAKLLERYQCEFPGKFLIVKDGLRLGAKLSFSELMRHADAPYVAFCDQDDFWLPEKLSVLLARILEVEADAGLGIPVLAHSDLEVVNQQMEPIAPSFWAYQGIDPVRNRLSHLLVDNTVTGCTVLMNRALLEKASSVPEAAYMHDYWSALVAAALGRIVFVRKPLVRYRQHGRNTLGAVEMPRLISLPKGNLSAGGWRIDYRDACAQAQALIELFHGQFVPDELKKIERFAKLYEKKWFGRRFVLIFSGVLPARWRRRLSVLARI